MVPPRCSQEYFHCHVAINYKDVVQIPDPCLLDYLLVLVDRLERPSDRMRVRGILNSVPVRLENGCQQLIEQGGANCASVLAEVVSTARASGTSKSYQRLVAEYGKWAEALKYDPKKAQVRSLYYCDLWKNQEFKKLFAVKPALDFHFGVLLGDQKEVVDMIMESARRCAPPTVHREKVDVNNVRKVLAAADEEKAPWQLLRYALFCTFGFFGLLRISEISELRWSDVEVTDSFMLINLAKSKTDQRGHGDRVKISFDTTGSMLKSVFQKYLASVVALPEHALLGDRKGKRLTANSWRSIAKRMGNEYGITQGPHGLRGGGATYAIASGLPEAAVTRLGRWRSEMSMRPYVDAAKLPGLVV